MRTTTIKLFMTLCTCLILTACDQTDPRIQAANIVYKNCIRNGEDQTWCRCLREDLKTGFSEEVAYYAIKGQQHPLGNMEINGARLRCQCRINPGRLAAYGLPCTGVKPLNF